MGLCKDLNASSSEFGMEREESSQASYLRDVTAGAQEVCENMRKLQEEECAAEVLSLKLTKAETTSSVGSSKLQSGIEVTSHAGAVQEYSHYIDDSALREIAGESLA